MNIDKKNIIQYDIDYILKIKDKYKELPEDLDIIYNECYDKIKRSDNYIYIKKLINSMIKIKQTTIYSELDKHKMNIISLLNKLTTNNLDIILKNLLNIDYNTDLFLYFIDNIYLKILNEDKNNEEYFNIILYIIKKNNYYIDINNNFYKLIINKCQDLFNKLLDNNYIDNLNKSGINDVDFYFKEKKNLIQNIKLIGFLYNNDLLSEDIILYIINNLLYNCDIKIEILCELLNVIKNKFNITAYQYSINNIYKNNNSRMKYILEELYDKKEDKKINKIENNGIKFTINNKMKLNNLIKEYLSHKNIKESLDYLKDFIKNYNNLIEDFFYISFELNTIKELELVITLLIRIITKYNNFDSSLLNNINEDFSEIILDIPLAHTYYNTILLNLLSNNIINKGIYDMIYGEINLNN